MWNAFKSFWKDQWEIWGIGNVFFIGGMLLCIMWIIRIIAK